VNIVEDHLSWTCQAVRAGCGALQQLHTSYITTATVSTNRPRVSSQGLQIGKDALFLGGRGKRGISADFTWGRSLKNRTKKKIKYEKSNKQER
jgi:hypothetical protein